MTTTATGTTSTTSTSDTPADALSLQKVGPVITGLMALNAIILGLFVLLWPAATVLVAAVLFGLQLIIAGVARIAAGVMRGDTAGWERGVLVILGALVLVAGIIALKNPGLSIAALVILIAVGWMVDGVVQVAIALSAPAGHRAFPLILGVLSIIASLVLLSSPVSALLTLLHLGGWLLVILGVMSAVTLVVSLVRGNGGSQAAGASTS
jgi:uncharacterized membrane protein HdeD (DUF308 family)